MEHFYETINGYSNLHEEGELLYKILSTIEHSEKINIAEIGVYKGRLTAMWNTILINENISYNYYAIDHFNGSAEHEKNFDYYGTALKNLSPIIYKINLIRNDSLNEVKNYNEEFFDIIYIDASHDYDSVKNDILHWLPKLKIGSVICGDDYCTCWPGVYDAVNEIFGEEINFFGKQQWWKKKY